MARIRTIKPEWNEDELMGRQSVPVRFLYLELIFIADDEGRFRAAPEHIKGRCYQYDNDVTPEDIAGWLSELEKLKRIGLYEVLEEHFGVIFKFSKHQFINRKSPSHLPAPSPEIGPLHEPSMSPPPALMEDCVLEVEVEVDMDMEKERENGRASAEASAPDLTLSPAPPGPLSPFSHTQLFNDWPAGRKGSVTKVRAAWDRALKTDTAENILAGAKAWIDYYGHVDNQQFAQRLENWLRDERWRDIPPETFGKSIIDAYVAEGER